MISSIDFAPTILDMLGVNPNPTKLVDGSSWLPLVQGRESAWAYRTDVFVEYGGPTIVPPSGAFATPEQRRTGRAMAATRRMLEEYAAVNASSWEGKEYGPLLRAAVRIDDEGDAAERLAMALQARLDRRRDEAASLAGASSVIESSGGGSDGLSEGMDELDELLLDLGLLDAWQSAAVGGVNDDDYPDSIPGVTMCGGERGKCPCDAVNNTYACVRSMTPAGETRTHAVPGNYILCQYNDDENFVEYYDLDKDPWNTVNAAHTEDQSKIEAIKARLRNFMSCKGASECTDPTGLWPPPMPAGSQKITRSSGGAAVCLQSVGDAQVSAVSDGSCYSPTDAWVIGKDKLGHGQFLNAADGLCLNLLDVNCAAGTSIHLYDCQGNDTRIHTADHFVYDASSGQIQMTECSGMCLGYEGSANGDGGDALAGSPATLQACGTGPGTSGWVLQ